MLTIERRKGVWEAFYGGALIEYNNSLYDLLVSVAENSAQEIEEELNEQKDKE